MFSFVSETTRDITEREVGETTRWRNDRSPNTEVLYSDPFLERPESISLLACLFISMTRVLNFLKVVQQNYQLKKQIGLVCELGPM